MTAGLSVERGVKPSQHPERDGVAPTIHHHLWRNYPRPGMSFPDPAVAVARGTDWRAIVSHLSNFAPTSVSSFAGIDIGGGALAGALGLVLGAGYIEVRKISNVRPELMASMSRNYALADGLAISPNAVLSGQHVVLVDDTLMSGSTAVSAVNLLRRFGAVVTTGLFIFEMEDQGGRELLAKAGVQVHAVQRLSAHALEPAIQPYR